jgi:neutral ceramidase
MKRASWWIAVLFLAACGGSGSGTDTTVPDVPDVPAVDVPTDVPIDVPPVDPCAGNTAFLVGAGIHDITGPAADRGMMGYVIMGQNTAGIHMRLRARAFVIASPCNGKRVAMVIADTQMLPQAVQVEVVARLKQEHGGLYDDQNVLLAGTHNHSGPGGLSAYPLYQFAPVAGFDARFFETTVDGIVKAIDKAHDGLRPGTLKIARGDLDDASINRSPDAFDANPADERALYPKRLDPAMTVLRLDAADGTPVGLVDTFGVHVTSVGANNKLITCDNKGYAGYLFEEARGTDHDAATGFVAGFFNSASGDVSPNVDGFDLAHKDGEQDFQDMRMSATKQYDKARELWEGATEAVTGGVDGRLAFAKFDDFAVDGRYADGHPHTTCPAASGLSMFAGGTLDWPGSSPEGLTCATIEGGECSDCQAEKPTAVPIGDQDPPLGPNVLPFQVLRIGTLAVAAVPFEPTTIAGHRIRKAVEATLAPAGVTRSVVISYANAYASYITTREEYAVQQYEGAFTVFGPWQLAATIQVLDGLAAALRDGTPAPNGPVPPVRDVSGMLLAQPSQVDVAPDGAVLGGVVTGPAASYDAGATASAVFWSANPSNDFRIQSTFLWVERKDGGSWVPVATDGAFETKFKWTRVPCDAAGTCSQATIVWAIPADTPPGTYRLRHTGDARGADGKLTPFEGASQPFEVL